MKLTLIKKLDELNNLRAKVAQRKLLSRQAALHQAQGDEKKIANELREISARMANLKNSRNTDKNTHSDKDFPARMRTFSIRLEQKHASVQFTIEDCKHALSAAQEDYRKAQKRQMVVGREVKHLHNRLEIAKSNKIDGVIMDNFPVSQRSISNKDDVNSIAEERAP